MIEIRLDVGAAQRYLEDLGRRAANMEPAMRGVSMELLSQTEATVAARGRPRWMELQTPRNSAKGA